MDRALRAYDETLRGARMKAPGAQFWMGTDNLERDMAVDGVSRLDQVDTLWAV